MTPVADVEQRECPNCGAPLAAAPGQTRVVCEFCGNALEIKLSKEERRLLHEERERRARAEREQREREEEARRAKEALYIRPEEHNTSEDMARMLGQVGQAAGVGGVVQGAVRTAVGTVVTGCIVAVIAAAGIIGLVVYLVMRG